MNFMAKSSRQGLYGDHQDHNQKKQNQSTMSGGGRGKHPFHSPYSTASSSPISQPHRSPVPLINFHHHRPDEMELMDASPALIGNTYSDEDPPPPPPFHGAADDDNDFRRADSSSSAADGLRLAVGGSATAGGGRGGVHVVEREHMFEKVVTPSDVGKLNRLVIPKQHAEKHFPLDSSANEKGLLLNFEDRNGKPWRFRYSYWNSSQSYVMTKGWSRFVKEKKLDAGDIVSFQRGIGELGKDRLFIDWRRRPEAPELPPSHLPQHYLSFHRSTGHYPWTTPLFLPASRDYSSHFNNPNAPVPAAYHYQPQYSSSYGGSSGGPYGYNSVVNPCSSSVIYLSRSAHVAGPQQHGGGMVQMQSGGTGGDGSGVEPMVFESVPVVQGKAAAKRLRLFGVNMDCPISESDECDILSSSTTNTAMSHHNPPPYLSSSPIPPLPLQLRLYNGSPLPAMHSDLLTKNSASNNPFDLDI